MDVQLRCLTYLPMVFRKRGQAQELRRLICRSLAAARERQSSEYEGMARANPSWAALRERDLAEARSHGQAALELWQPPARVLFKWLALLPLIGVALTQNQISQAIAHARVLLEPDQQPLPKPLKLIVEEEVRAWEEREQDTARLHLKRVIESAQEMGYL